MSPTSFRLCRWLVFTLFAAATLRAPAQPAGAASTNATSARVVVVQNNAATYDLQPTPEVVQAMVDSAIKNLTGKESLKAAWRSLVSNRDTVGIKVYSAPGPNSGTRPAVAAAVVTGLLAAGLPPKQIVVWDQRSVDLRLAGFYDLETRYGIRVTGALEAGWDATTFYETPLVGQMNWTDLEFNQKGPSVGRKSYVSRLVSQQLTKIINIAPLMHHNLAGVYGCLYSLSMGSVDNTLRFQNSRAQLNKAVPEIYALPVFGDKIAGEKVVLSIVDALICQYEGQDQGLLHYSTVLNQLRFSRDPVALDTLSLQEMNRQCQLAGMAVSSTNYDLLENASLLEIGVSDTNRISVVHLP